MKKLTLIITIFTNLCFSQNIVPLIPDTVIINSGGLQSIDIPFVNNTNNFTKIGVSESPVVPISGIIDTVGFFSWQSPPPNAPETIYIEPWDTLRAFYHINPGSNNGYHVVQICFWDVYAMADTVCAQMVVYLDETANMFNDDDLNIQIYPNPTQDFINIDTYYDVKSVIIHDIGGMMVYQGDDMQINVQNLDPGIYFSTIKIDGYQDVIKKFIKR
jgi:hypothetical protein